ncbi:MAG TPA: alginate lyase family protein [Terriglobales bacterium]
MASGWQSKLARVSRMDWEEVRVRVGQEFHKQSDLLKHRMGVRAGAIRLNADHAARRQFFFSASDFSSREISERAALLRKHLPVEAFEILREADEICAHRFRLLGYENLAFHLAGGNTLQDIDWHLDPVHGKRAPRDPWFKIPFLDFAVVGDHKVRWELNRHQHLVTLAKARLLSGNENDKYVPELMAQWRSWIKANPYPLGINWGSTLEVAFRSLSWIWVDQLLAQAPEYAQLRAELLPALAFHGRYIERYLSTYFSPNTHLLGEAVALLFLGTLYPQMPGAARWKESGWKIVRREAERQVRPDGVYFEQSLYYHIYALDFFLYSRLLAARNGMKIPPAFDAVLERMLAVIAALAQAGPAEGFGDDDGGRLWNPRRNRTEQMTDPLALGAVMYSSELSAARLTEEAIWLFGNQAVEKLARANSGPPASPAAHSLAFPEGGLYVLADSAPYAQAMVADAGPQGVGRSGHGHADALSLRLTMDGRRWLVDAGSGVYIAKDPADRDTFRGTGAHNTLRVDEVDQAVADEPFSWTHIPTTQAENWIEGKSFTYFVGSHNGYARLADPVLHRRHVLNLKNAGGLWLVRDVALGQSEHDLEIRWHFAPDLEVRAVGPGRVEVSKAGARSGESGLTLLMPEETIWYTATEVSRTLLSPAYGAFEPAPLLRCHARVLLPAETATALVPRRGEPCQEDEPCLASMTQAAVQVYELDSHDESDGFFFARGDQGWSFGPWSSDARMLYCRIEKEKLAHLAVIDGTHVKWQGQPLLKSEGPFTFFEWRRQDVVMNAEPNRVSVTSWFEELTGDSPSSSSSWNHGSSRHGSSKPGPSHGSSSSYVEKH